MSHYDIYGKIAEANISQTVKNGRYDVQKNAEAKIPKNIIETLKIQKENSFLDIGCGLGLNLGPISKITSYALGIDHPKVVNEAKILLDNSNAEFIGGDFLKASFSQTFDRILAYSVVHTLSDIDTIYKFIEKALSLLNPDGMMMLGDLPNIDKKKRFLNSKRGQVFQRDWEEQIKKNNAEQVNKFFEDIRSDISLDDKTISEIMIYIRDKGFNAYILNQPQNLPFGNSREDILIIAPEFSDGLNN